MARIKVEDWLTEDSLNKLELYKKRGYTDKQIAGIIGISERTFTRWKSSYPSLLSRLKKGKENGIDQVEITMFDKALGYTDKANEYHAPETTAGIFILKNMRRECYQDKPLTELQTEKIKLEIEKIKLENEVKRRILEGDDELDKLDSLLKAVDDATIVDAKDVP